MQVKAGVEQAFGDSMNRVRVDYKLRVHTVPGNLTQLAPNQQHLQEMSAIYRKAMESRLLWDLWLLDEYGAKWTAVSFENDAGEPEFHTLKLDEGTYRMIPCEPYEAGAEPALSSGGA